MPAMRAGAMRVVVDEGMPSANERALSPMSLSTSARPSSRHHSPDARRNILRGAKWEPAPCHRRQVHGLARTTGRDERPRLEASVDLSV